MTSISKYMYIDKLDNIVDDYNNTYHRTIKMRPADVRTSNYVECNTVPNDEDSKFQVGDLVRISKYKNVFPKRYSPNFS